MRLHSCSYTNIWPFQDKTVLVNFFAGSHLIQAPIWSGKSFLFFDGPLFALYKHRSRPILNKNSSSWRIQLIFEVEWDTRCIERSLTPTRKWGESVKTKFWRATWVLAQEEGALIVSFSEKNLFDLYTSQLEEIEFTSWKEADSAISDLLPPKELLMSVNFLVQESSSVFELAPAERVEVFKHLFGLIWIDEVKNSIHDKRKSISTTIATKWDFSLYDTKVSQFITKIKSSWGELKELPLSDCWEQMETLSETSFFTDLPLLWESITVKDVSLDTEGFQLLQPLSVHIDWVLREFVQREWEKRQVLQQIQDTQHQQRELLVIKQKLNAWMERIQRELSQSIDESAGKKIEAILEQYKATLKEQYDAFPFSLFEKHNVALEHIRDTKHIFWQLINEGKHLAQQKGQLLEQQKLHQERLTQLNEEYKDFVHQEKQTTESFNQNNSFSCDKIDWACPYVSLINKQAWKALEMQIQALHKQQEKNRQQVTHITDESLPDLDKKITTCEQDITKIKWFLQEVNRKETQLLSETYTGLEKDIQDQEKALHEFQQQQLKIRWLAEEKIKIEQEFILHEKQLAELSQRLLQLQTQEKSLTSDEQVHQKRIYERAKSLTHELIWTWDKLSELLIDIEKIRWDILWLQQQEKRLKELYAIFSKELMVVVLQDFLPSLQDVLNSYLAQIVDYEVRFTSPVDEWAQLELDIEIHDEKWVRNVKSLSGGQKTILKLVWMLSVATLFRSNFLFLDETINNLDIDTIAQVADVIDEFVSSSQVTFYVVTHSPQIQQMNIWESTIAIPK